LYGGVKTFIKAKEPKALERYIIRFSRECGYYEQMISLATELRLTLVSDEPAIEVYDSLDYLCTHPEVWNQHLPEFDEENDIQEMK
jgi:hypothetical protein